MKFIVETQEEEHGGWNDWNLPDSEFDKLEEAMAEAKGRASHASPSRVIQVLGEWFERQQ